MSETEQTNQSIKLDDERIATHFDEERMHGLAAYLGDLFGALQDAEILTEHQPTVTVVQEEEGFDFGDIRIEIVFSVSRSE